MVRHALTALLAALVLAACAAPPLDLTPARDAPRKALVSGVPLIEQADFHCGPAALAMALQWTGQDVTQSRIADLAFTPGARGTFQENMLGAARRLGALAVPLSGFDALTEEIAAGHPVIVFQNLGESFAPIWHYAVVTGYDLERGAVTLHSGQLSRTAMSLAKFERTWAGGDGWALLVLSPGELPASSSERAVLDASAGLERAGQTSAAIAAYRAGAAQWPDNWLWQFGLGNALYASGDTAGARRAYQRAIALDPTAPEPRQNLSVLNTSG
jgi:tetratricopeptide (TPR) repeat protein